MNTARKDDIVLEFNSKKEDIKHVEKESSTNSYFYKVANHAELYKLGSSYLDDFKAGLKSFTISSTGYYNSQQKTIIGLASFFDHYDDLKIAIISDNLFNGYFQEVISSSKQRKIPLSLSGHELDFFSFHHHFDFIDLNILLDIPNKKENTNYEQRVNDIINYYDVIFWDMPELHNIQNTPEIYYPAIQSFDSLSIIVSKSMSKSVEVDFIRNFFESYNISIKGLLFDPFLEEKAEVKEKKAWWKFFK